FNITLCRTRPDGLISSIPISSIPGALLSTPRDLSGFRTIIRDCPHSTTAPAVSNHLSSQFRLHPDQPPLLLQLDSFSMARPTSPGPRDLRDSSSPLKTERFPHGMPV